MRRHYFCAGCGDFEISKAALSMVDRSAAAVRKHLASQMRDPQDDLLFIISHVNGAPGLSKLSVSLIEHHT